MTETYQRSFTQSDRVEIKDIHDVSDINKLSTRQLKYVLTKNHICFKGVFEKEVLIEKVIALWIDIKESIARRLNPDSTKGYSNVNDSQACKICWEQEINSVILECGHLVTCLDCGVKLDGCPICRQPITRIVRTFKV